MNSEYLLSGSSDGVGVWQVEDGERVATMKMQNVKYLALSNDGRMIVAGTASGDVFVLDLRV